MENLQKSVKIYTRGKNYYAAENACMKMSELDMVSAYNNLGYVYYRIACDVKPQERKKDATISEIYFLKALELDHECVSALNGLAQLYQITGRIDDVIEFYRFSLLVEDSSITRYNLALAIEDKKRREIRDNKRRELMLQIRNRNLTNI